MRHRHLCSPARLLRDALATLMLAVVAPLAHAQALDTPTLRRFAASCVVEPASAERLAP